MILTSLSLFFNRNAITHNFILFSIYSNIAVAPSELRTKIDSPSHADATRSQKIDDSSPLSYQTDSTRAVSLANLFVHEFHLHSPVQSPV